MIMNKPFEIREIIGSWTDEKGVLRDRYIVIGKAWPHKTGGGFDIELHTLPNTVESSYVSAYDGKTVFGTSPARLKVMTPYDKDAVKVTPVATTSKRSKRAEPVAEEEVVA